MTRDEKLEVAIKCILAIGYFIIGFYYLFEAFPLKVEEEVEIKLDKEDCPTIINIMQFRKQHEEEEKDDA